MTNYDKMLEEFNSSPIKGKIDSFPKRKTQKGEVLLYYWENVGTILTKEQIEKEVCSRLNKPTKDLQSVRHLAKQDGFNILQQGCLYKGQKLKRGCYVFLGFNKLNEYYSIRRRDESDLDWADIKKNHGFKCLTCGEKEGTKHRKTGQITRLEKGHRDPSKDMSNNNIIPQCSYCNQYYGNRFVFDNFGNVKSPTIEGVLSMSAEEKKILLEKLRRELK
jgi:hypothetical protein